MVSKHQFCPSAISKVKGIKVNRGFDMCAPAAPRTSGIEVERALFELSSFSGQQIAVIMLSPPESQDGELTVLLEGVLDPEERLYKSEDNHFVVLKPVRQSREDTASAAHRLSRTLNNELARRAQHIHVGAATHLDATESPRETLFLAHCALEWSLTGAGSDVVTLDSEHFHNKSAKARLLADLSTAIERSQFQLYFQPIVSTSKNAVIGAEALLRWNHHRLGQLTPDFFIPLAESSQLIGQIGTWVFEESCKLLSRRCDSGERSPFYISLNVSSTQIPEEMSYDVVASTLSRYGIAGERIVFEITEGLPHRCLEETRRWMRSIQSLGIRIFMDDFGIGHSSPLVLKHLPFDAVKIDRAFVQRIPHDHHEFAFLKSMLQIPQSKGVSIIAEGVDCIEHIPLLNKLGCDRMQGYLFSPPLPEDCLCDIFGAAFPVRGGIDVPEMGFDVPGDCAVS